MPGRAWKRDPSDPVRAHNARASMAALESVARALREVQGRRKSILFFSEGVDYDTLDVMGKVQKSAAEVARSMERAVATATWNNVAFYPFDPRGMVGAAGPDHIEAAAPPQDRRSGSTRSPSIASGGARGTASSRSPRRRAARPPWTRTTSPAHSNGSSARTATTTSSGTTRRTSARTAPFEGSRSGSHVPGSPWSPARATCGRAPTSRRERRPEPAAATGHVARAARAAGEPLAAPRSSARGFRGRLPRERPHGDRGGDDRAARAGRCPSAGRTIAPSTTSRSRCSRSTRRAGCSAATACSPSRG